MEYKDDKIKIDKTELKQIINNEAEKAVAYSQLELEQSHEDLHKQVLYMLKHNKIYQSEFNVGYTNMLTGNEENTTIQMKKGSGFYFTMCVDLDGKETRKEITELADFFIEQLELNIDREIKTTIGMLDFLYSNN